MTHRTDIVWFDAKDTVQTVKDKLKEVVFSTYPVCDGVVDEIKGLVYVCLCMQLSCEKRGGTHHDMYVWKNE